MVFFTNKNIQVTCRRAAAYTLLIYKTLVAGGMPWGYELCVMSLTSVTWSIQPFMITAGEWVVRMI